MTEGLFGVAYMSYVWCIRRDKPEHIRVLCPSGAIAVQIAPGYLSNRGSNQIIQIHHIQKTPQKSGVFICGASGGIRTPDQVVRSHLLYPAELRMRWLLSRFVVQRGRYLTLVVGVFSMTNRFRSVLFDYSACKVSLWWRCFALLVFFWSVIYFFPIVTFCYLRLRV